MVPKIGLMVPKKWYDPIGSILQRFYLKIHIINDFWGGGARPNGVQTRSEYAPIFEKNAFLTPMIVYVALKLADPAAF